MRQVWNRETKKMEFLTNEVENIHIFNVLYKGGYIGYILVPSYSTKEDIIRWLAWNFNKKNKNPEQQVEIAKHLTLESKKSFPSNYFFKRMVFNDHELGDEFSFASV